MAVAAALELAVFAALWFCAESARDALGYYVAVFGVAGALAWGVAYHVGLRLKPLRPQRARQAG